MALNITNNSNDISNDYTGIGIDCQSLLMKLANC